MRIIAYLSLIVLGLLLVGCRSSNIRSPVTGGRSTEPFDPLDRPSARLRGVTTGDDRSSTAPTFNGVLAGRVIDERYRPIAGAVLQVVDAEDDKAASAPIDRTYTANEQGYFRVPGLEPGKRYRVIARIKAGDRALIGSDFASPPQSSLVIRVREDPADKKAEDDEIGKAEPIFPITPATSIERPPVTRLPATDVNGDVRQPLLDPMDDQLPLRPRSRPSGRDVGHPPAVPITPRQPRWDRTINVSPPTRHKPSAPLLHSSDANAVRRATPVPSASVFGRTVNSFALRDLSGRPFHYPEHRRGKLTLLDFWRASCMPCVRSVPELNRLQSDYGRAGLEVIGIACEPGRGAGRAQQARAAADRHRIAYRVLLSGPRISPSSAPLLHQLQVSRFPTLLLLDEDGKIVWQSVGMDARKWQELRVRIERELGLR